MQLTSVRLSAVDHPANAWDHRSHGELPPIVQASRLADQPPSHPAAQPPTPFGHTRTLTTTSSVAQLAVRNASSNSGSVLCARARADAQLPNRPAQWSPSSAPSRSATLLPI